MSVSKKKTLVRIALISMMTVVMLMSSVTVFAARGHFYSSWASQGVTARITYKDLISRLNLWRGAGFPDQGDHDEIITDLKQTTHSGSRIDVKNVTYKDTISKKCVYDVSYIDDGKLKPVIIAVHGGSWNGGSKNEMIYVANTFVPQGYVVVLVEYETLKNNKYIEDQISENLEAVKSIASNASRWQGDKNRMVMLGYSSGGQIAARVAQIVTSSPSSYPFTIKAFVDYAGPCDMNKLNLSSRYSYIVDGNRGDLTSKLNQVNPICFVNRKMCPTLILHGKNDSSVPISSSENFYQKLLSNGVKAEFHTIIGLKHTLDMNYFSSLTLNFLQKYL